MRTGKVVVKQIDDQWTHESYTSNGRLLATGIKYKTKDAASKGANNMLKLAEIVGSDIEFDRESIDDETKVITSETIKSHTQKALDIAKNLQFSSDQTFLVNLLASVIKRVDDANIQA
jgi:hypothetical protein